LDSHSILGAHNVWISLDSHSILGAHNAEVCAWQKLPTACDPRRFFTPPFNTMQNFSAYCLEWLVPFTGIQAASSSDSTVEMYYSPNSYCIPPGLGCMPPSPAACRCAFSKCKGGMFPLVAQETSWLVEQHGKWDCTCCALARQAQ
jgi:hypothetical protein